MAEVFEKSKLLKLEKLLKDRRRRLAELVVQIDERMRTELSLEGSGGLSHVRTHPADTGTQEFDADISRELGQLEEGQLREVEAALARLRSGSYGFCERCGAVIPYERLEAVPEARFCAVCEGLMEESAGDEEVTRMQASPKHVSRTPI